MTNPNLWSTIGGLLTAVGGVVVAAKVYWPEAPGWLLLIGACSLAAGPVIHGLNTSVKRNPEERTRRDDEDKRASD